MKVKLTLILSQQNITLDFENDDYFRFFISDNLEFPNKYISTKNELETLRDIFSDYFNIYFDWAAINLSNFRKCSIDTCEVVYTCKLKTTMIGLNKSGKFISINDINKLNLKIDPFYEEILQKEFRRF